MVADAEGPRSVVVMVKVLAGGLGLGPDRPMWYWHGEL